MYCKENVFESKFLLNTLIDTNKLGIKLHSNPIFSYYYEYFQKFYNIPLNTLYKKT